MPWLAQLSHLTSSKAKMVDAVVDTAGSMAVTIEFSNTVRAERSEDRHRKTPIAAARQTPPEIDNSVWSAFT